MRLNHTYKMLTVLNIIVFQVHCEEPNLVSIQAEVRAIRAAYESRIADLEGQVKDLRSGTVREMKSANQALDDVLAKRSPAERAIADAPVASARPSRVTVGGYAEFSYTERNYRVPEFNENRVVAELSANLSERLKFYSELEFENAAVQEGVPNGGEIEVEQAYLDFTLHKSLAFRAGVMLVPLGRFNLNHEGFINNHVDRPLVDRWVAPSTWYEEGVGLHGQALDTKKLGINYELDVFNPARASKVSSETGFREIRNEGRAPESRGKSGAGRIDFEPARGAKWFADNLELGLSGYISGNKRPDGPPPDGTLLKKTSGALTLAALDFTYEKKDFGLRSEAALARSSARTNLAQRAQTARGFYAETFYSFHPCWLKTGPIGKSFKDPRLVVSSRFDWIELNPGRDDSRDLRRVTFGLSYRPLRQTVFKLDYQMDFSSSGLTPDTLPDSGRGHRTNAVLFGVATGF